MLMSKLRPPTESLTLLISLPLALSLRPGKELVGIQAPNEARRAWAGP